MDERTLMICVAALCLVGVPLSQLLDVKGSSPSVSRTSAKAVWSSAAQVGDLSGRAGETSSVWKAPSVRH